MTNEERAKQMLGRIVDIRCATNADIAEVLAYADEIRHECDDSVQFVLTKVGINTDAGIRKVISAAIMGKERRMTLESARCTRCGSNNFILMCVKCNDIGRHDEEIRRECAEKAVNWIDCNHLPDGTLLGHPNSLRAAIMRKEAKQ